MIIPQLPLSKTHTILNSGYQAISSESSITSSSKTGFDVRFKDYSQNSVIESQMVEGKDKKGKNVSEKTFEVNTYCKTKHITIGQKKVKSNLEDYIEGLMGRMLNVNGQIEKQKESKNKISEENMKIIFNQENISENSKLLKRQIIAINLPLPFFFSKKQFHSKAFVSSGWN